MEQAGRTIEWDAVVVEFDDNKKLSWHCDKPSRNDGIFEFEQTEKGTSVSFTMDYDLPYSILGMILDRVVVRSAIEQNIDEWLASLKKILEGNK